MSDLSVKIKKTNDNAILPSYRTMQAAGMDLYACLDESVILNPMKRVKVPTGLAIELPDGYELQIRARSSLGANYGITLANGVGTIDSDYRGEFSVVLINLSEEPFVIEPSMRIAQAIVAKHEHVIWDEVNELEDSERGAGGFGSTGVK